MNSFFNSIQKLLSVIHVKHSNTFEEEAVFACLVEVQQYRTKAERLQNLGGNNIENLHPKKTKHFYKNYGKFV